MEIAIIADVHLANHPMFGGQLESGVNNRARLILNSLDLLLRVLEKRKKVAQLVIAGDLFDKWRVEPQLLHALREVFRLYSVPIAVLPGNHDERTATAYDNAIAGLGQEYLSLSEQSLPFVGLGVHGKLVTILHKGIFDNDSPTFLQNTGALHKDQVFADMQEHGSSLTFSGDYHDPAEYFSEDGTAVIVPGAFVPTGFDNPGVDYGYCWIVDLESNELSKFQVPGPRFATCHTRQELFAFANECYSMKCQAFIRFKGELDLDWVEQINASFKKKVVVAVDHVPILKPTVAKAPKKSSISDLIEEFMTKNNVNNDVRDYIRKIL